MDGEQPQTLAPPIAVAVTRRPRVGGRVFVRLLMWSLPFLAGRRGAVLLAGRRPLCRDRQRLRQGRPGLCRHRIERPDRRGRGPREPARLARPASLPARRHAVPAGARQDRIGHRDPARRDSRPARAVAHQARGHQGGAEPAGLCPGRLRAPEGPRRPQVRASPPSSRNRACRPTSRASASPLPRRTCSASRRSSPAIRRSRSTIIPGSSRCWRRATRRCSISAGPRSRRRWTASSPRCWCRAAMR